MLKVYTHCSSHKEQNYEQNNWYICCTPVIGIFVSHYYFLSLRNSKICSMLKKMTKKLLVESDMYIGIVIKRISFIKIKSLKIIIKFISSHKVTRLWIKTKYAYKNDRRKNKWIAVTQGFLYKLPTKFHIQNVALQKNKASLARLTSTST